MPSAISKRLRNTRRRSLTVTRPQPTAAIEIASVSATGSVLTVAFNQPVSLNGVPQYTTDLVGVEPTEAELTSPMALQLTFSAAVTTATELRVPYEEPAVRNSSGGFVSTSVVFI